MFSGWPGFTQSLSGKRWNRMFREGNKTCMPRGLRQRSVPRQERDLCCRWRTNRRYTKGQVGGAGSCLGARAGGEGALRGPGAGLQAWGPPGPRATAVLCVPAPGAVCCRWPRARHGAPESGGDGSDPAQLSAIPGWSPSSSPIPALSRPCLPSQSNLTFIVITSEPWVGAVPRKAAENNVMGLGRRGNSDD